MRAFCLEDHKFFNNFVKFFCEERKIEIVSADSFKEGIELWNANKDKCDFAILDLMLANGKTGVDFYNKVMERKIPCFFVTGCIDESMLKLASEFTTVNKLDLELEEKLDTIIKNLKK